jgi:hypothetical protein
MRTSRRFLPTALTTLLLLALTAGSATAAPANDDFANAETMTPSPYGFVSVPFDLADATAELGEPVQSPSASRTIWFEFVAAADGFVRFSTCDSDSEAQIDGLTVSVLTGTSVATLTNQSSSSGGCASADFNAQSSLHVQSGETYHVQLVAADVAAVTAGNLALMFTTDLTGNDDFTDALPLDRSRGTADLSMVGAGNESGEPLPGDSTDQTVWFDYTAPGDGLARFSTCTVNASYALDGTHLAVYSGTSLGTLTEIDASGGGCGPNMYNATLTIPVTDGETYHVQVSAARNSYGLFGSFDYDFNAAPPANDQLDDASAITGALPQAVVADNGLATTESDETDMLEWATQSLWYSWTPGSSGPVAIDTCSTVPDSPSDQPDSKLNVYTSSVAPDPQTYPSLVPVDANDDGCSGANPHLSRVLMTATAGTTYFIRVANASDAFGAPYLLTVRQVSTPELGYGPVITPASAMLATGTTLTADHGSWTANPPVTTTTYQWSRCDANGDYCSDISGATDSTYTTDSADIDSRLRVTVTGDNGIESASPTSPPSGVVSAPPTNDDLADAADLGSSVPVSESGRTVLATLEVNEMGRAPFPIANSVWYRWTAPAAGHFVFDTCDYGSATLPTSIGIYTADDPPTIASLVNLGGRDGGCPGDLGPARADLVATEGTTYLIQVGGTNLGDEGDFTLRIDSDTDYDEVVDGSDTCPDEAGTKPNGCPTSVVSNGTAPQLTGTFNVGETIDTSDGTWSVSGDPLPLSYDYQWQSCTDATPESCDDIAGATDSSYELLPADYGKRVRAIVTASNSDDSMWDASAISGRVSQVPANDTPPSISGTARVDQVLTGSQGTWTPADAVLTNQWLRCNNSASSGSCSPIPGQTGATYTPDAAYDGMFIRLRVTATTAAGTSSVDSAASAEVVTDSDGDGVVDAADTCPNEAGARPNGCPPSVLSNSTPPAISGVPFVGEQLNSSTGNWTVAGDPIGYTLAYRWQRCPDAVPANCTDIPGAPTTTSYTLTAADYGKRVRVVVTASNADGSASQGSALAGPIKQAPANSTPPSISGTAKVGQLLTGAQGTWTPADAALTNQWLRCTDSASSGSCSPIAGQTGATYTLVAADAGNHIRLRVTASTSGGDSSLDSPASAQVTTDPVDGGGGSPPPPPPPPADPLAQFVVPSSLGTVTVKKSAFTLSKIAVACGASATGPCTGSLTLTTAKTKGVRPGVVRPVTVRFTLSVAPGGTLGTKFKANSQLAAALKKAGKLKATIVVSLAAPGGAAKSATTKATLKAG